MYNICDSQGEDTKMQKRKFVLMVMIIMLVKGNACRCILCVFFGFFLLCGKYCLKNGFCVGSALESLNRKIALIRFVWYEGGCDQVRTRLKTEVDV